jgi:flavin reductase (DIM6/NTAB) family NADH-FMN oxidoreductase RutF
MKKIKIGDKNYFYPSPTVLVGVMMNGRPNYLNVSYAGIVNRDPAMLYISLNKNHYSTTGVKANKTFSINIPSSDMLPATDYCGLVSGKDVDKSLLFHTFYGLLKNVPMIEECPINVECEVIRELELEGSNVLFIGKVIQSYSEEKYLTNGLPDLKKIDPILLSMNDFHYYCVGNEIGKAWDIGKSLKE